MKGDGDAHKYLFWIRKDPRVVDVGGVMNIAAASRSRASMRAYVCMIMIKENY